MAWYEYTTWKRQGAEIRRIRLQGVVRAATQSVKAEMRAETQRALERIITLVGQTTELRKTMDERQNFRLTVIERMLGILDRNQSSSGCA